MLVQAIPGMVYWGDAGLYNVSGGCAAIPSLPPLTFTIDNVDYTLSPEQYILQVILRCTRQYPPIKNSFYAHQPVQCLCWESQQIPHALPLLITVI